MKKNPLHLVKRTDILPKEKISYTISYDYRETNSL